MVWGTVLTFVCMLRYWMRNVVPRGLQWNCNEVLDVRCTSAEFCSPCDVQQGFRSLCGICGRCSAIHAAYTDKVPHPMRHIQPEFRNLCGIYGGVSAIYIMQQYILQKYTKFRLIHFGSVLNCRYRSIQTQVSFFQHSTIVALYKKGPGVCRGARPCAPLRFSHIPMLIYPLRGPQPMCHTAGGRSLCGIYGRGSAIYIMQQYILQKYTKFRLIHFGSVSNCRYRSIQTQVSFFQHSTIAALYKKGPGVCRGARPCAPLRFSHIPM